ncbi:MAG: protein kinase [Eubacteriales bacterium]|nr:protein kinase [Eubacteriales bacterium]
MLTIGSVLDGKYKILNQIGTGGMSTVYLAMNEKVNRQWAVKEIKKDRPYNFALMKQGILREMEMLRTLYHPMIPRICDVIEKSDAIFIVMDYIEGRTLGKLVEEEGAQEERYIIAWAKQLCQVLAYLHSRIPPIIYRDMKPANIMLKPNGDLMLIDFGISREFCADHTEDTICLGTQGYAAPEQFGGGQSDERTDIYGLGATLYHLAAGESPNKMARSRLFEKEEDSLKISEGLERIIKKCMAENPQERYQSSRELWYALEHYQELECKTMKRQKKKLFLCGGLLAQAVFSLGVWLFSGQRIRELQRENYECCLQMASNQEGEEKILLLKKAADINPKKEETYLKLIEEFLRDNNFSHQEDEIFREILNKKGKQKKTYEMMVAENKEGYEKIAYETGTAYFFFYENTGSKERSIKWFQIAREAENLEEQKKVRASVCVRIAEYWKDMGRRKKTGDFEISHGAYFQDLRTLYQMQREQKENKVMTLKVCQEMFMQMIQYTAEMMKDGITAEEMKSVLEDGRKEIEEAKKEAGLEKIIQILEEELKQAEQKIKMERS